MKKVNAQVWVSSVLYVLVVVSLIVIVLAAGVPIINHLKDKAAFNNLKNNAQTLDSYIQTVISEGPGSQRLVPIVIDNGKLYTKNNSLIWQIPVSSKVMQPNARITYGNVIFLSLPSNSVVSAYESPDHCYYILDNGVLRVNLTEFGNISKSAENCSTEINTSKIINSIYSIKEGKYLNANVTISLINDASSSVGQGYSYLQDSGNFLGSTEVIYYINSTDYDYSFSIGLQGSSDFLSIQLQSFTHK